MNRYNVKELNNYAYYTLFFCKNHVWHTREKCMGSSKPSLNLASTEIWQTSNPKTSWTEAPRVMMLWQAWLTNRKSRTPSSPMRAAGNRKTLNSTFVFVHTSFKDVYWFFFFFLRGGAFDGQLVQDIQLKIFMTSWQSYQLSLNLNAVHYI